MVLGESASSRLSYLRCAPLRDRELAIDAMQQVLLLRAPTWAECGSLLPTVVELRAANHGFDDPQGNAPALGGLGS